MKIVIPNQFPEDIFQLSITNKPRFPSVCEEGFRSLSTLARSRNPRFVKDYAPGAAITCNASPDRCIFATNECLAPMGCGVQTRGVRSRWPPAVRGHRDERTIQTRAAARAIRPAPRDGGGQNVARPDEFGEPTVPWGAEGVMAGGIAAAVGILRAGGDFILINDGRCPLRNLLSEELHPAAHLPSGSGRAKEYCQREGAIDQRFDAVAFVGRPAIATIRKRSTPIQLRVAWSAR